MNNARCEKCRNIHLLQEGDSHLFFDFLDKEIVFMCPHCKHENKFDFVTWKKQQKHSPLPSIGVMRG